MLFPNDILSVQFHAYAKEEEMGQKWRDQESGIDGQRNPDQRQQLHEIGT